MPHHVPDWIKTKKDLREALQQNKEIFFKDPSFHATHHFVSITMREGDSLVCTNHPKRSWFASVKRESDGFKVT